MLHKRKKKQTCLNHPIYATILIVTLTIIRSAISQETSWRGNQLINIIAVTVKNFDGSAPSATVRAPIETRSPRHHTIRNCRMRSV